MSFWSIFLKSTQQNRFVTNSCNFILFSWRQVENSLSAAWTPVLATQNIRWLRECSKITKTFRKIYIFSTAGKVGFKALLERKLSKSSKIAIQISIALLLLLTMLHITYSARIQIVLILSLIRFWNQRKGINNCQNLIKRNEIHFWLQHCFQYIILQNSILSPHSSLFFALCCLTKVHGDPLDWFNFTNDPVPE